MLAKEQHSDAYYFVADWHERQARTFLEMSRDEPRIDAATRARSKEAAWYHNGSAAALRLAATNARRALIGAL